MPNNRHATYPVPIIKEALCEIQFNLQSSWNSAFFSNYFAVIRERFPTFEPTVAVKIEQLSDHRQSLNIPIVMRYRHESGNALIQLSENRIVVNVLPIYYGWQHFSQDILYSWDKLRSVVEPLEITRIGLRYINSITRSSANEKLSKWLKPTDFVPLSVLESQSGFNSYISSVKSAKDRIQVSLVDQQKSGDGFGAFIFDIDRVTEEHIAANEASLSDNLNRLHDDVWDTFSSAKGESLELLMKGEFP